MKKIINKNNDKTSHIANGKGSTPDLKQLPKSENIRYGCKHCL